MKIIKYLLIIACRSLLVLGGLVASLNFIDLNQHKGFLEKQFTELMGREISIKGDSELSLYTESSPTVAGMFLEECTLGQ